ncbi:YggS family pyridoxal phosphate-dependent enzyme [Acinetobacter rudis]|uniref:Pyridoxal phosphate homeostasis protein n=1 Tax=Acinetobacter rudis CIP 110305 TaxID=421052 RepID=S3MU72_9GAMM|nr:YggS family pyridoxal phosphate-dependent enzyme [Acinetobacter rudis]EPF71097.1 YggS family pyridoxal phosphate enzyme [Acinetobacter rudis CIP 110305]
MNELHRARREVLEHIQKACEQANRSADEVQLLAVSKTHPSQAIEQLYQSGQRAFGENYLQEALDKIEALKALEIEWHFIGHVQRNKTKHLAEKFAWVHGVDRLIIAQRLSQQRPAGLAALNICLQVNIDQQDSKDGCAVADVVDLVREISALPNLRLRGIMVIPAPHNHQAFNAAAELFQQVKTEHVHAQDWDTLSMGMSADLQAAITAGSTMVRIGTALFGQRSYDLS